MNSYENNDDDARKWDMKERTISFLLSFLLARFLSRFVEYFECPGKSGTWTLSRVGVMIRFYNPRTDKRFFLNNFDP